MNLIQGHFNGTGADVYLCLGTIPYRIDFWNLEASVPVITQWDRAMIHDILTCEGLTWPAAGTAVLDHAFGEGISPYYGGDLLTTTSAGTVTYGEGVYLERDDKDYRYYTNSAAGISGDAASVDIDTWTLDTAATPSGHFNGTVTGTYIGEGSLIRILDSNNKHLYEACITALTAAAGTTADDVTLSWPVPSGKVVFIGGKYSYKPMVAGQVTKPGVLINYATLNVNDEMISFSALCP